MSNFGTVSVTALTCILVSAQFRLPLIEFRPGFGHNSYFSVGTVSVTQFQHSFSYGHNTYFSFSIITAMVESEILHLGKVRIIILRYSLHISRQQALIFRYRPTHALP